MQPHRPDHPISNDRRKHQRFIAKERAFVSTNDNLRLIGQILDVSLGGICFKYITNGHAPSYCNLDIFMSNRQFYLESIPCQVVSDTLLDPEIQLSSIPISRCGVKFVVLTQAQEKILLNLIGCFTE